MTGTSVSHTAGFPMLISPAPVVHFISSSSPKTSAKAKTLSFVYFRCPLKSPGFFPPKMSDALTDQSRGYLVCRLLLEKKKNQQRKRSEASGVQRGDLGASG